MRDCAERCRLRRSDHANFIAPRCNNRGGKAVGLRRHGKKAQYKWFYASSDSLYDTPFTSWDTTTISKMGPTITVGSAKAQGSKAKPAKSGQSRLEQPERGIK
jgi:hypothetical protein